jgi:hypothetical protein
MIEIKKQLTIIMVFLGLVLLLAGCAGKDSSTVDITNKQADKTATSDKAASSDKNSSAIFGKIDSIDGNKITIAVAQQPERKEMTAQDNSETSGQSSQNGSSTQQTSQPGEPPAGGSSQGGTPPGSGGTGPQMELTDEKQVVIVADDTVIKSGGRGNGQNSSTSASEIKLADLKADMVVEVTLKADSTDAEKTASEIRVMSRAGQRQAQ